MLEREEMTLIDPRTYPYNHFIGIFMDLLADFFFSFEGIVNRQG